MRKPYLAALAEAEKKVVRESADILQEPEPLPELFRAMQMLHQRGCEIGPDLKAEAQAYVSFRWLAGQPGPRTAEWDKAFEMFRGDESCVVREAVLRSIPQPVPEKYIAAVMKGLTDRDLGVARGACEVAGKSGDPRFVKPLLKIIATGSHQWLLREATNAMKVRYELYEAWVARMAVINHADFILEKVNIDHCVVGVYADRINNVVLRDVVIIPDNKGAAENPAAPWSSWVGVWWDTLPNPDDRTSRSDCLIFDNVTINCNAAPGTGVLWDGMTNTFLINYANILNGAYGFRVINSRHNTKHLVPQFLNAFSLLIENAATCLSIETGCEFKITSSDMDMCKENTVQILPDLDGSPTDCVQITNSRIGNCQKTGIVIDARDVKISNTQMFSTSLAGRGRYPVIEIGAHAHDVSITDVRAEEYIGSRKASHAVSIDQGASNRVAAPPISRVAGSTIAKMLHQIHL